MSIASVGPIPVPWALVTASLLATAGCARVVEPAPGASTGGGGPSGSTATSGSTSAGTSSAGGSGPIGPLACGAQEALLVAASDSSASKMHVLTQSGWSPTYAGSPASQLAALVDPYGAFGVFRIALDLGSSSYARSMDGTNVEEHAVTGWSPTRAVVSPTTLGLPTSVLLGRSEAGDSLGYFDTDAFDWYPYGTIAPGSASASGLGASTSTGLTVVGRGTNGKLCWSDADLSATFAPWACLDVDAPSGGEIPVTPPTLVSLVSGDQAAVFYSAAGSRLSATVRHAGAWGPVSSIESAAIGVQFAATGTSAGDLLVATTSTAGELSFVRFDPAKGFGSLVHVRDGVRIEAPLAAESGVCGDDAFVAFVDEAEPNAVGVARVRGTSFAEMETLPFAASVITLDLASRRGP